MSDTLDGLINRKVVIYCGRYRYYVIVFAICHNYIKGIEVSTGHIKTFNLNRIDYIEDILP
ncbi:hypothetical protein AN641_08015 [Candidatus Epulonipiscioides gigas]|nr:hypothetical protein AN641_08015 [Epulopiscium sp. SCG-C07WGA-EpuloA2]